jgi:2-polyprenyl-3-methyl-5-hydroxy-6-metoxy-1,4-benzoquinol methylase
MTAPRCPACGVEQAPVPRPYRDQNGSPFRYLRCPACGLQQLAPGQESEIAKAYDATYYGQSETKFVGWIERLRNAACAHRARWLHRVAGAQPGIIADLGCGNGQFLARMAALGWQITGTELPGPAYDRAARIPGINLHPVGDGRIPLADASARAITVWHVLEHVPDPAALLAECRRVLAPDGVLAIEVPNAGSWQAGLTGTHWFHLDPPRHLWQITRPALRQWLTQAGFTVESTGTFSFEMSGYGALQSMLNALLPGRDALYGSLRTGGAGAASRLAASVLLAGLLAVPAGLLTITESACGAGAVLRVLSRPRAC